MEVGDQITKEMREDILTAWSEAEEITANFDGMSKPELIQSLDSIKKRSERIRDLLGTYISGDDLDEICPL